MKKCPFCAEEIQDAAIKCRHCGEFLDGASRTLVVKEKLPWPFRTSTIIIAVCCVGPLALPLVWWRPKTPPAWKTGWTISILLLSWFLLQTTMSSIEVIREYYEMLNDL